VFAGLRISEACNLRWGDVNLASGWITLGDSTSEAGLRDVNVLRVLLDELKAHKPIDAERDDLVFPTSAGTGRDKDNAAKHVVAPVVKRADERLAKQHLAMPGRVTAHKLRHTVCSLLFTLGENPAYVMAQLGHTDARFTLGVYAHVSQRRDPAGVERLKALVEGSNWQSIVNKPSEASSLASAAKRSEHGKGPR
jgi:integrase